MSLWNSFTCWYEGRNISNNEKILPTTSNEPDFTIKNLICSSCYKYLDDEKDYIKKAIIGNHLFGFCHTNCYYDWLKQPQLRFLGKIN